MHEEQPSHRCVRSPTTSSSTSTVGTRVRGLVDVLKAAVSSRLFLMTTLGAVTGQVPALAAEGLLASPAVAAAVGLTVMAGVGAFVAAMEETSLEDARGRRVFTATAVLSIGVNVAAAGVGLALSSVTSVEHLRSFAAVAIGLVAWEIARGEAVELPMGVPATGAVVALGLVVEAVA